MRIKIILLAFILVSPVSAEWGLYGSLGGADSDHGLEGQVDTHLDQSDLRDGLPASQERGEGDIRPSVYIGAVNREGPLFVDLGVLLDTNHTIETPNIHYRMDSVSLVGTLGYETNGFYGRVGGHVTHTEVDVHTWLKYEEYHDQLTDLSAGPVIGLGYRFSNGIRLDYLRVMSVGDKDRIGSDDIDLLTLGYEF